VRARHVAPLTRLWSRRRQLRSIRFRLTIWYTAVLAATLLVFGLTLYALLVRTLAREADQDATRTAQGIVAGARTRVDPQTGQLSVDLPDLGIVVPDIFVQVTDPHTGQALARSPNLGRLDLPDVPASMTDGDATGGEFATFEARGTRFRLFNRPIVEQGQVVAVVQVARSQADDDRLLRRLRLLLLSMGGLALPTAAALGWILARRALAPVGEIARATEVIGRARDFSRRVVYSGPPDELWHLARMINSMLAELEVAHQGLAGVNERLAQANTNLARALAAQQRFVAAASH
jgi:signal transduction histidine kinase